MSWTPKKKTVSGNQIIDSSISFDNLGCTIDEDNMASDSATHVPTQQSVKAYVDANGGGGSSQWTTSGSDIYYNTGNVGIGTTNPASTVHIQASANALQLNNANEDTYMKVCGDRAQFGYRASDGYAIVQGAGGKGVAFGVNNATFGSGEAMRIDSSGKVGIGNTNPYHVLDIDSGTDAVSARCQTNTTGALIAFKDATATEVAIPAAVGGIGNQLSFVTNNTEKVRIDDSGNVGIGTSSPGYALDVDGLIATRDAYLITANSSGTPSAGAFMFRPASNTLALGTNSTERMRIDSSGNLLVGKTSATATDLGCQIEPDGQIKTTSNGQSALTLNRKTSDGAIAIFQKDGTTIGSIGATADDLYIGTGNTKLRFDNASDAIYAGGGDGTGTDNNTDLGKSDERFKDLHLSGSGYIPDVRSTGNQYLTHNTGNFLAIRNSSGAERMRIDSSGKVGIGTTDPHSLLHVDGGDVKISSDSNYGNGDGKPAIFFSESTADNVGAQISYHGDDETGDDNFIGIGCSGGTATTQALMKEIHQMVVTAGGKVGIGTDNPAEKLHISRADVGTLARFATQDGTNNPSLQLSTTATGVKARSSFGTGIVGSFEIEAAGGSSYLAFSPNSTEAMRVKANGNVGIGTASPDSALEVQGSTNGVHQIHIQNTFDDDNADDPNPSARLYLSAASNNAYIECKGAPTDLGTQHEIDFGSTAANSFLTFSPSSTEAMRITSSGNVGIGTNDPASLLHLESASAPTLTINDTDSTLALELSQDGANGSMLLKSAGTLSIGVTNNSESDALSFQTQSTERMRISADGKVAIGGAVDATVDLRVHGETTTNRLGVGSNNLGGYNIESHTSDAIHALFKSSSTTASYIYFRDGNSTSDGAAGIGAKGDECSIVANGSERIRIDSSGNVGIGETNPAHPLDVSGRIHSTSQVTVGSGNHGTPLGVYHETSAALGTFTSNATGAYILFEDATSQGPTPAAIGAIGNECFIIANGTEKVRIDDTGNVGIGTNDPTEKLDVQGNITATGVAKLDGGSATAPAYTFDGDTNTGMYSPAADNLAFSEGGVERMRINSAGRVLIGTTSQGSYGAKLRVLGGRIETSGYVATGNSSLFLLGGNYGAPTIECRSYTSYSSNTQKIMRFAGSTGTERGSITIAGVTTSFNTSSDERLKENISDAEDAGSKIDAIRIRQFDWKDGGEHQDYGVIAQELQSVAPEAVSEGYDEEDMWSVDYSKLVPTLIKEIQTLRNRVAQLENNE